MLGCKGGFYMLKEAGRNYGIPLTWDWIHETHQRATAAGGGCAPHRSVSSHLHINCFCGDVTHAVMVKAVTDVTMRAAEAVILRDLYSNVLYYKCNERVRCHRWTSVTFACDRCVRWKRENSQTPPLAGGVFILWEVQVRFTFIRHMNKQRSSSIHTVCTYTPVKHLALSSVWKDEIIPGSHDHSLRSAPPQHTNTN